MLDRILAGLDRALVTKLMLTHIVIIALSIEFLVYTTINRDVSLIFQYTVSK